MRVCLFGILYAPEKILEGTEETFETTDTTFWLLLFRLAFWLLALILHFVVHVDGKETELVSVEVDR